MGGAAVRLLQHGIELWDKDRERKHEKEMYNLQLSLAQAQGGIDAAIATDKNDAEAMVEALKAQSAESIAAGGFVVKLSAAVRPVISYWLLLIYTFTKGIILYMVTQSQMDMAHALPLVFSIFDETLLGSIVSYWFADRSLRKAGQ